MNETEQQITDHLMPFDDSIISLTQQLRIYFQNET